MTNLVENADLLPTAVAASNNELIMDTEDDEEEEEVVVDLQSIVAPIEGTSDDTADIALPRLPSPSPPPPVIQEEEDDKEPEQMEHVGDQLAVSEVLAQVGDASLLDDSDDVIVVTSATSPERGTESAMPQAQHLIDDAVPVGVEGV